MKLVHLCYSLEIFDFVFFCLFVYMFFFFCFLFCFFFAKMLIEKSSTFHMNCVLIAYFDWLLGPVKW